MDSFLPKPIVYKFCTLILGQSALYCAMAFVRQLWRERVTPMLLPQLPRLGSDCSSSELLSKKTQVQSAARQRDHVDRVGTELKMVFRLKI